MDKKINPECHEQLQKIAAELHAAKRVLFVTGAGISAESGLPTYRGVTGLYNNELTDDGLSIEACLSAEMLRRKPSLTWHYLLQIEENCRGAIPNAAHLAIAALDDFPTKEITVLTQNVDSLHRAAGSQQVIEIHGDFRRIFCTHCDYSQELDSATGLSNFAPLPTCPLCGKTLRVPVVLFGESLPEKALGELFLALEKGFDMVFVIGTTCVFPYVAHPVEQAVYQGIPTVEINPDRTVISDLVEHHISLPATIAMTEILAAQHRLSKRG